MAVTRIKDLRRQDLLSAAFEVLKRDGLSAATIDKIAGQAGLSKGIVHHYFGDKDELIFAVMRQIHAQRRKDIVERLRMARSPSERIWAVVSVNLGERYLNHDACNIWISFVSEAFANPEFSRLQKVIRKRERSNLLHALRQISSATDAENSARRIMALMCGCALWTGYISGYGSKPATAMTLSFLRTNVPGFDTAAAAMP
jgi:TetR/AcrR family transcriptional regulator, transcriptional repressor of bet genes